MSLAAFIPLIGNLLDRVLPDPKAAADAKLEVMKLAQNGELAQLNADVQLAVGQMDINKIEAANSNVFVSGWRPAIGWTCAISLFCYYVPYVLVATGLWAWQVIQKGELVARPDLGIGDLLGLVMALLGMAGMRTFEKTRGVAK